ncbi:acid protease [Phellopilus nigrolimitatus]|nr:acid protease [Phellopilus nigrolimitatus]
MSKPNIPGSSKTNPQSSASSSDDVELKTISIRASVKRDGTMNKHDRVRSKKMGKIGSMPPNSVNAHNFSKAMKIDEVFVSDNKTKNVFVSNAAVNYITTVKVGASKTPFNLMVDSGSANTVIRLPNYKPTGKPMRNVKIKYCIGSFEGDLYLDTLSLGEGLEVKNQAIGVSESFFYDAVDGILGIGPVWGSECTLYQDRRCKRNELMPTVTDNLFAQKKISASVVEIGFEPTVVETCYLGIMDGELAFGGVNMSKIRGEVTYTNITSKSPAANGWGIDQTVTYGDSTVIMQDGSGIIDTGSTLIYFATDAYSAYQEVAGALFDEATGLLRVTEKQYGNMKSLFFHIAGRKFELTKDAQIWPRKLYRSVEGKPNPIYFIVGVTMVSTASTSSTGSAGCNISTLFATPIKRGLGSPTPPTQ